MAEAEKINRSYVCRVLRLALLAPEIIEAILEGRQPEGVSLRALMKGGLWSGGSNGNASLDTRLVAESPNNRIRPQL